MAQIESKHDVRRKVRDAQAQANRERLKRESDNRGDMVAFLVAEQKLSAVSQWEAERHAHVRLDAEQRRAEQRLEGARALARMRDRGETVADIGQLGSGPPCPDRAPLLGTGTVRSTRFRRCGRCVGRFAGTRVVAGEDTPVEVETSTAAAGVGGHPSRRVTRDGFRAPGAAVGARPWVDPKVHAAEGARFRSKIVAWTQRPGLQQLDRQHRSRWLLPQPTENSLDANVFRSLQEAEPRRKVIRFSHPYPPGRSWTAGQGLQASAPDRAGADPRRKSRRSAHEMWWPYQQR